MPADDGAGTLKLDTPLGYVLAAPLASMPCRVFANRGWGTKL
jgi:hypothetical protein